MSAVADEDSVSEANCADDDLVSLRSHELRTPLARKKRSNSDGAARTRARAEGHARASRLGSSHWFSL